MAEADELQREAKDLIASVRAYLEQQMGSGATGIPRGTGVRPAPTVATPAAHATAAPTSTPTSTSTPTPHATSTPHTTSTSTSTRTTPATAPSTDPAVRLPQLAREISTCTRCRLAETRTQTVFARGNPASSICFIGEAPGADEDAQGLPFVGRAGQLLDKMIGAMGLSPERDVYVINIIRCRPPENRRPEPDEIAACLPYLHEQLDLVKPKVIVALGNTSVAALLGTKVGISKLRGQWKLYRGTTLVMPTYHPSYLLRPGPTQIESKKQAWADLQAVLIELKLPIPTPKRRGDTRGDEDPS